MPYNDSDRSEGRPSPRAEGGRGLRPPPTPPQSQGHGNSSEVAGRNVGGGSGSISTLLALRRRGRAQETSRKDLQARRSLSPQNVSFHHPLRFLPSSARSLCWAIVGVHPNLMVSRAPASDGDPSSFSCCRRHPSAK